MAYQQSAERQRQIEIKGENRITISCIKDYPLTLKPIYPTMKKFTIVHILLFLLMMLVYQCANAQDYVVTTRGDSLTGETRPLFFGPEKKVQLVGENKEKTTFSLFEVRAFSTQGEIYHPVKGEKGYVFMKLIQPGYLSLYAFQMEDQTRFDGLMLKKMDGATLLVPNLGFKKYLGNFLDDCPEVSAKVREGEFGKKDLKEMINAYNGCIANRTVDHGKAIVNQRIETEKSSAWASLEEKVRGKDFSEKDNALDMIAEVRKKIQRQESIPNFLLEGLKKSLEGTGLSEELGEAIAEVR
jgi:hypothetical protein